MFEGWSNPLHLLLILDIRIQPEETAGVRRRSWIRNPGIQIGNERTCGLVESEGTLK